MAKFSQKMGGKEVGQAAVYAKPHTMSGGELKSKTSSIPGTAVSIANINGLAHEAGTVKTTGIKVRGTGAATKGTMARGPMA